MQSGKFHHLIEAVVYIALNAKPDAVRGPAICKAQNLPERYLEADLQRLVHSGILRSVRGPKGGYVLAKERRNITLADIYLAGKEKDEASQMKPYIAETLKTAEGKYVEELSSITVEALCLKAGQVAGSGNKADFTI